MILTARWPTRLTPSATVNNTLRHFGHPKKPREVRLAIGDGAQSHNPVLPEDRSADAVYVGRVLDYYSNEYAHTFLMTGRCYPGMRKLYPLVRRGYGLAILSNKPDRFIRELTELLFRDGEISFAAKDRAAGKPDPTSAHDRLKARSRPCRVPLWETAT